MPRWSVNDIDMGKVMALKLERARSEGVCTRPDGTIKMKALVGHFNKGVNRFIKEAGAMRQVLSFEM